MIVKNKIVTKSYFIIVVTLCVFFIVAFISYATLMKNINAKQERIAPLFIAKILDILDEKNKIKAVKKFYSLNSEDFKPSLELFDQNGRRVYPEQSGEESISPDILTLLGKPYDHTQLRETGYLKQNSRVSIVQAF